jgi:hypothetical protein
VAPRYGPADDRRLQRTTGPEVATARPPHWFADSPPYALAVGLLLLIRLLFGREPPRWVWAALAVGAAGVALGFAWKREYGWSALNLACAIFFAADAVPSGSERLVRRRQRDRHGRIEARRAARRR